LRKERVSQSDFTIITVRKNVMDKVKSFGDMFKIGGSLSSKSVQPSLGDSTLILLRVNFLLDIDLELLKVLDK